MEGMEKQERTGYAALHKLLQGLPVPVHKTAGCMTQAEAFQGFMCTHLRNRQPTILFTMDAILYPHNDNNNIIQ
jgi:hypothetical protein